MGRIVDESSCIVNTYFRFIAGRGAYFMVQDLLCLLWHGPCLVGSERSSPIQLFGDLVVAVIYRIFSKVERVVVNLFVPGLLGFGFGLVGFRHGFGFGCGFVFHVLHYRPTRCICQDLFSIYFRGG